MPIIGHPSFDRPPVTARLWRYTDLPKFVELLTSARLWLTNMEVLATDDPYEGLPDADCFSSLNLQYRSSRRQYFFTLSNLARITSTPTASSART